MFDQPNYNNSQLIYGEFDNDVVTLPYLCLRQTPSAGSASDSVLVWNSTDKKVKLGAVDEVDFNVKYSAITAGNVTIYNPSRRNWTILNITNAASTYTITLSAKPNSSGTNTITNVEHYITVKNTNASAKTLVIQLETTGHKLISEGLTSVPLPASGIYEISFIFLTRGSDTVCIITKSTLLTEITT